MAARQLQRLRAQQDEEEGEVEVLDDDDASPPTRTAPFNPFDLLDKEDEDTEPAPEANSGTEEKNNAEEASKPADVKSKSSGKRRKKKKGSSNIKSKEAAVGKAPPVTKEEDLDELLESMNIKLRTPAPQEAEAGHSGRKSEVLTVDLAKLKPENELRRIFGSRVVDSEAREDHAGGELTGASRRVRRLYARGLISRVPHRPGVLITPKDHWPVTNGDLTMELVGKAEDGRLAFTYVHTPNYKLNQELFEEVQCMHDPNELFRFLWQRAPYHVDALWAGHELYRATGQHEQADDMLAMLLYGMERAWHPQFHPTSGNCMLLLDTDERVSANLPFFRALFRHSQDLSRRGMHVTALECCKLLLALNEADPMGGLFCIDFLAIKALQFSFLQDFVASSQIYNPTFGLAQTPNLVYALALASFLRNGVAGSRLPGQQGPPSGMAEKEWQQAVNAVLLYPLMAKAVLERLREKDVGKDAEWTQILADPFFLDADDGGSATLAHLVAIYVERSSSLWKEPASLGWLKRLCLAAISEGAGTKANWQAMRESLWSPSQENAYSHLRISNFSEAAASLPPEELQALLGGPGDARLPPGIGARNPGEMGPMDIDLPAVRREFLRRIPDAGMQDDLQRFMDQPEFQEAVDHMRAGEAVEEGRMQVLRPVLALLQTMLPRVNMGQAPDYAAEDDAAREAARAQEHEE